MRLLPVLCFLGALATSLPAAAITIDLDDAVPDFQDGRVNRFDQSTTAPVTLTFVNGIVSNGASSVFVDTDGIAFGRIPVLPMAIRLDFRVNVPIRIDAYDIDFVLPGTIAAFRIVEVGGGAQSGLNPVFAGVVGARPVFNAGSLTRLNPGRTYRIQHTAGLLAPNVSGFQIDEFDVTIVPLPVALPLLAGALAGLGLLHRRR